MRSKSSRARRGFTLIELLTVIAIIAVLVGMLAVVVPRVKIVAQTSASKQMFSQWCTAVSQYKASYNTYPYLNGTYNTQADTIISLNSTATVAEFIKCLTGKNPIFSGGTALIPADQQKYNRQATEFTAIDKSAFELDGTGQYTQKLCDGFGNTNIRLIMDTDGNGMVKPTDITGTASDYGIDSSGFIDNKVIIYTLKSDDPTHSLGYQDVLSWQ